MVTRVLYLFFIFNILTYTGIALGKIDKNCLKIEKNTVCFPEDKALFNDIKDPEGKSIYKKCVKSFLKNKIFKIKYQKQDLLFFQANKKSNAEMKIIFSKKHNTPTLNIGTVKQKRRGTMILPHLQY